MKKIIRHEGMTLIELLIYVVLVAIFIVGVVAFGIEAITVRAKAKVEEDVISDIRKAMKRIEFEIRNASDINSISLGGEGISLANSDPARNPTFIARSGTRIEIGWGTSGPCPVTATCYLTGSEMIVHRLTFINMSDATNSANVRFAISARGWNPSNIASWEYVTSSVSSAEVRSK